MKRRFGTRGFSGLNTRKSEAAREDAELQQANNVSWEELGCVKPVKADELLYTQAGTPRGYFIARWDDADNHIFKTGLVTYDNNTAISGLSTAATTLRMAQQDEKVYCFDSAENRIYDGTRHRSHGPITGTDSGTSDKFWKSEGATYEETLTSITKDNPAVVTKNGHGLDDGNKIYIDGVSGMTEINGGQYIVANKDTNTFELTNLDGDVIDSSNFASAGTGGTAYQNSCGIAGDYMYRRSWVVTMPDGAVIESDPSLLEDYRLAVEDTTVTLAETNRLAVYVKGISAADLAAYVSPITGVEVSIRVYRTKAGGTEFYLLHEFDHDASYDIGADIWTYDRTPDADLGALFTDGYDDHGAPPVAAFGVFVQQRLFLADGDDNVLYKSGIGQYDYYDPLNGNLKIPEKITGLGRWNDEVIIFSAGRMWAYSPVDEIGHLRDVPSPGGTTHPDSICETPYGLVFANDEGAWVYVGSGVEPLSDEIYSLWVDGESYWRTTYADNAVHFAHGTDTGTGAAFVLKKIGGGARWATGSSGVANYLFMAATSDRTQIFGLSAAGVYEIYGSSDNATATIQTKAYGDGQMHRAHWIFMDIDTGGNDVVVSVQTNRTTQSAYTVSTSGRRVIRQALPHTLDGEYFTMAATGDWNELYGMWVEVVK